MLYRDWLESIQSLRASNITEEDWGIDIVRAHAARTALEELTDATDKSWCGKMLVRFVGEEAVDGGGPRREMLTLLFAGSDLFDGEFFKINAGNLEKKAYFILGKAVAYGLVFGHPGPQRLHKSLANYILWETEPEDEESSFSSCQAMSGTADITDGTFT